MKQGGAGGEKFTTRRIRVFVQQHVREGTNIKRLTLRGVDRGVLVFESGALVGARTVSCCTAMACEARETKQEKVSVPEFGKKGCTTFKQAYATTNNIHSP